MRNRSTSRPTAQSRPILLSNICRRRIRAVEFVPSKKGRFPEPNETFKEAAWTASRPTSRFHRSLSIGRQCGHRANCGTHIRRSIFDSKSCTSRDHLLQVFNLLCVTSFYIKCSRSSKHVVLNIFIEVAIVRNMCLK